MKQRILDTLMRGRDGALRIIARQRARTTEPMAPREPFHAVEVRACRNSCGAARQLANQRFLSAEAPRLPLPACDQAKCTCAYQHFADRRQEARRDHAEISPRRDLSPERRRSVGRRIEDRPAEVEATVDYFRYIEETQQVPRWPSRDDVAA